MPSLPALSSSSLSRGLAFFSIGLGLAEVLAPRHLARLIGVDEDHENLLRALGLREIGSGLGIMQGNSPNFLWSRVAGDAMDLGLLFAARKSPRSGQRRVMGAIVAVAGVAALDVLASILATRDRQPDPSWRVARTPPRRERIEPIVASADRPHAPAPA